MPRYYRLSPRFWADTADWTDDERTLALYLLTSPHRTTEGLFRLPKAYICADLDWTPERLSEPFAQLLRKGFIHYDEAVEIVLITKALKYQSPSNPNQIKAALAQLDDLPHTDLFSLLITVAERYAPTFGKGLRNHFETVSKPLPPLALTQAPSPSQMEPTVPAVPDAQTLDAPFRNGSSKEQALARRHLETLKPAVANGGAFDLLHEFRELWPKAWQEAAAENLNPKAVGINLLGNFIATVTGTEPDWGRAGQLVGKFGKLALFGIDEGIIANADDPYRYAFRVCQNQARNHRAEVSP